MSFVPKLNQRKTDVTAGTLRVWIRHTGSMKRHLGVISWDENRLLTKRHWKKQMNRYKNFSPRQTLLVLVNVKLLAHTLTYTEQFHQSNNSQFAHSGI